MNNNKRSNVSEHAFINLVEIMGGDLSVVNSARVSYGKSSIELTEKDERLIHRLLRDKHGTPFEQAVMTWYIRCPIFVAREWMRHRVGSFNEISGRYKELNTDYYTPKKFRVPGDDKVQMNYKYGEADDQLNAEATDLVNECYENITEVYRRLLDMGIAKEHARIVLPVGIYTEFRWTVNARALMNFLALRNHPAAMGEIRAYARSIEHVWSHQMPVTHAAFTQNNRVAP